jgi:predicted Zn-dependent protease
MQIKRPFPVLTSLLMALCVFFALSRPAAAQTIIRDAEIEEYMAEWFAPVFKAANMAPDQVKIIIVQDPMINAFVAGGANIFFYTGLLDKTDGPGEVIGVMSHELGHIAGGHLIRAREAMENASYEAILGSIIGVGAAILSGESGAAGTIGAASTSMATRKYLTYSRAFESSADQFGLSTMEKAQLNPATFGTFLEKLEDQEMLPASQQSEYVRTHPLTRSRIDSVEAGVERSAYKDKAYPPEWIEQHARMKAKLLGFISPQQVAWTYDDRDHSVAATTARAIAAYRTNDVAHALKLADTLIGMEPSNAYFQELKGQMLMDFGRVKEAVPYYQKAASLKPANGLIRTALGHAKVETAGDNPAKLQQAINDLETALKSEPRSSRIHRLLATAYGRMGDDPNARLHLAEEALLQRKLDYARAQATIALKGLKQGSSGWLRAKDMISYLDSAKPADDQDMPE